MKFIDPEQRYSDAVIVNEIAYLGGQVPADETADIYAQTKSVLQQIDDLLTRCGSHRGNIIEATIFLRDLDDYNAFNTVWDAWVIPERAPARACVQALLANPQWRIEIKLSAFCSTNYE